MIEAFAFGIAALAFAGGTKGRAEAFPHILTPALALVGIALLGVIQLIPNDALSPMSASIYAEANAVMRLFGRPAIAPRISLAPNETKATILLTLAYAALFTAAAILVNSRARRRWLAATLFITMSTHVLVAASLTGAVERMHGAFVNPNHFAGYLEIGLAFAFGLIWAEVLTGRDRVTLIRDRGERLEKRALPFVWRILLWGVIAAGIALTRSRGGVIAAIVTTIVLIAMSLMRKRGERAAILTLAAIVLGIAFVAFTTGEASLLRFLGSDPRDINTDTRVTIWRGSIEAWRMFPNFGDGLGAFKEAFRRVQPKEIDAIVDQAHNDFLQLLVTGGWIGTLLGAVAFGSVYVVLLRGWLRQQHREESAFILAGFGALLSLTLHGAVEFNMSIPAIPATLAILSGAALAATRA
jgi:O-antigen ligase